MTSLNILLLSCYELGHQPMHLAWPLASLRAEGIRAHAVDLAVEPFPETGAADADFVGIAVPMHTALRIGVEAARRIRKINPGAHICFYGLYASLNAEYLLGENIADDVLAGEFEPQLVKKIRLLTDTRTAPNGRPIDPLSRQTYPRPYRAPLPALYHYAHLTIDGLASAAGYTETTRGCLHTCTHCPVVPVYNGRFFAVPVDTVMADIRQQVDMGACHITFGDPDFLNGPSHALRVARALHDEFPYVTFDFTTKVEHILKFPELIPELRSLGAAFVVSAFESLSDETLLRLEKGHTAADLDTALEILDRADLPVQPTLVAFAPWTSLEDYLALLAWVRARGLIEHVPVVQFAIRLLIPPKSRLLKDPDAHEWLGPLDAANFSYCWDHPDPRMDALHREIAGIAEKYAGANTFEAFGAIESAAYAAAGLPVPSHQPPKRILPAPPRLTEDWFC